MRRTTSQRAIKGKLLPLICIMSLVLFPNMMAYAISPTSTPAPAASPTPYTRPIMESFDVQLFTDGTWRSLEKEMMAAHDNYCYYDGILMFMPLNVFVEQNQIPCIKLSKDFNYQVIALDPGLSLEYSYTIYNQEWEAILYGETPTSDWDKLDSGKYLMSINVYATDSDRYASTKSLFWLIVGDYKDGEEHTSVPTLSPS